MAVLLLFFLFKKHLDVSKNKTKRTRIMNIFVLVI